jgi:hypothetical protein
MATTVGFTTATPTATFSSAQTAGNCNVVLENFYNGSVNPTLTSVVDTKANGPSGAYYTPSTGFVSDFDTLMACAYAGAIAAAGAGTNTVTVTNTAGADGGGYDVVAILEFSGVLSVQNPIDVAGNAFNAATSAVSLTITTTVAGDLVVAAAGGDNGQTAVSDIAGTLATKIGPADYGGVILEYGTSGAAGSTVIGGGGFVNDDTWTMVGLALKPAGGGGGAPNPQASFPDGRGRAYLFGGGFSVANQFIAESTFQPNPSAQFPDKGSPQWKQTLGFHTSQRIDPATFQPTPSGIWVDRGYARPNEQVDWETQFVSPPAAANNPAAIYPDKGAVDVPDVPAMLSVANQRIDPATFQPTPSALYNDRGTARPWQNLGLNANQWINPALDQPNPSTIYPDRGIGRPFNQYDQPFPQFIAESTFQPNPSTLYADAGYGRPTSRAAFEPPAQIWVSESLDQPNPSAIWIDKGYAVSFRPDVPLAQRWIAESTFQPTPGAIWADKGYGLPFRSLTESTPYLATPPTVTPLGSWPDKGHAVPTTYGAHYLFTSQWINPSLDQPNSGALYPDRGNEQQQRAITEATPYVSPPPAQVPLASWPDRGHAIPTTMGALFFSTSQRIDPATFQPNVSAIWVDRGYAKPNEQVDWETQLITTPQSNPSALWPDKGTAEIWRSIGALAQQTPSAPVVTPTQSTIYPDRGHATPTRLGAFVFESDKWISPALDQPNPSAIWRDIGYGAQTTRTAHEIFDFHVPPPPAFFPIPIYPDRGYGRPVFPVGHGFWTLFGYLPAGINLPGAICSTMASISVTCATVPLTSAACQTVGIAPAP